MDQKRRHFRIDLEALIQCSTINEEQASELATAILSQTPNNSIDSETVKMNKQIQDAIAAVTGSDLKMGLLLDLMNQKINIILRELEHQKSLNPQNGTPTNVLMPVNLSGGGALIYHQQELEKDSLLDLKITFIPEHVAIRTVSRVIKSFPAEDDPNGPWKIAIEFAHMHEEDKDRVVRKVLQEQTKQLREQKRAERRAAEAAASN